MNAKIPRIIIGGTGSGCGKTTVTCAILQALVKRGLKTGAFKCGPDYIDPMFHSRIIGAEISNLDSFFFDENTLKYLLAENAKDCDVSVIEGVMGFYDGMDMSSGKASTYEISRITDSPVLLVVDAKGASRSVLAVIHGFLTFMPENGICGVILNRCTQLTYELLASQIEKQFEDRVRPLGFLHVMAGCSIESRHLGLVTAEEITDLKKKLDILASQAEKSIDIDGIMEIAGTAPPIEYEEIKIQKYEDKIRIAVAKDSAFCFYYKDSLKLLEDMGAELVVFSPLNDKTLPEDIHGIYLGGGYPELYKEKLSRNASMRESVKNSLADGMPCIAECGGFMYLTESIEEYPMAGFFKGNCFDRGKLTRFGYITLKARKDNMLCKAGEKIPAHEFHYWDSEFPGEDFIAEKITGRTWDCVFASEHLYAGYPHFHFWANPDFAVNFYEACLKEKHRHD